MSGDPSDAPALAAALAGWLQARGEAGDAWRAEQRDTALDNSEWLPETDAWTDEDDPPSGDDADWPEEKEKLDDSGLKLSADVRKERFRLAGRPNLEDIRRQVTGDPDAGRSMRVWARPCSGPILRMVTRRSVVSRVSPGYTGGVTANKGNVVVIGATADASCGSGTQSVNTWEGGLDATGACKDWECSYSSGRSRAKVMHPVPVERAEAILDKTGLEAACGPNLTVADADEESPDNVHPFSAVRLHDPDFFLPLTAGALRHMADDFARWNVPKDGSFPKSALVEAPDIVKAATQEDMVAALRHMSSGGRTKAARA